MLALHHNPVSCLGRRLLHQPLNLHLDGDWPVTPLDCFEHLAYQDNARRVEVRRIAFVEETKRQGTVLSALDAGAE